MFNGLWYMVDDVDDAAGADGDLRFADRGLRLDAGLLMVDG